jgi:DNA-binding YbaB/EbfC family protein
MFTTQLATLNLKPETNSTLAHRTWGITFVFNPHGMLDMMKMMGKVKEMQARLKEAQDKLDLLIVHGEAGAGMVKATVNGKKKVLAIEVDPSILSTNDKVLLQDLVVAAVNKAMEEAEVLAREELRKSTEGMLPQVPGLDLSQLMG